jgi:hypothetical protein
MNGTPFYTPLPTGKGTDNGDDFALIMLVPITAVGLLLGKAGQFFKYIGHISGAQLHLQSFDEMVLGSRERTLTITGTSMTIATAVYIVIQRLQTLDTCEKTQWIIPQGKAGLLIGKHGSRIKMINDQSGAWVKMAHPEETPPSRSERTVYIRGTALQTQMAVDMIQQIAGGRRMSDNDDGEPIIVPRVAQDGILVQIPNHVSKVDDLQITGIAMAAITVHDFRFKPIIKHRVSQWLQNNTTSAADDDMCLVILVSSQVKTYPPCYQRVNDSVHNTTDTQVLATVASLESIVVDLQQSIQIFSVRPPETLVVPPLPLKNTVRRNLSPEELFVAKMDRLGISDRLYGMF